MTVKVATPKSRGIIFTADSIRGIQAGTKMQTRRILSPQPTRSLSHTAELPGGDGTWDIHRGLGWHWQYAKKSHLFVADKQPDGADGARVFAEHAAKHCPYGGVGSRLWVKETWSKSHLGVYPCPACWYRGDFGAYDDPALNERHYPDCTGNQADCHGCVAEREGPFKWRPSIYMPRHLSRIRLEITSVRVERLQDITEEDARAEGVEFYHADLFDSRTKDFCQASDLAPRERFMALWTAINGKRAPWGSNPWVFVVSFRVLP
jgi:hypothetical protein